MSVKILAPLRKCKKIKYLKSKRALTSTAFLSKFLVSRNRVVRGLLLHKMIILIAKNICLLRGRIVHQIRHLEDRTQLKIIQVIYKNKIKRIKFQK